MADKNKNSSLEATLNAPVFVPGGNTSGQPTNGKEASQKEKMPHAAGAPAGAGGSKSHAASHATTTTPAAAMPGSKAGPGSKIAAAGKLSAAAAAAPVFIPSGSVAVAPNGGAPPAAPGSGPIAGSAAAAPSPGKGNSKQHNQQQQTNRSHQQQQQASQSSKAAETPPGIAKPGASAAGGVGAAGVNSSSSSSNPVGSGVKGASKSDTAASASSGSSSSKGAGSAAIAAGTKGNAWGNATATVTTNSASSSTTAAPKMSASAAAFVPGKAATGPAAPATGATVTSSSSSSSAAVSTSGKQAAPSGQQAAPSKGWNASASRSPGQQRPAGGSATAPPTPSSNSSGGLGPGRGGSGGRGAGGRGGRLDFGSGGRGPMNSMQRPPMGGMMSGPGGLGPGSMGTPRRGGGVGGPGTLASAQGQYMVPQGLYSAGPGRQLMAARFMSEALRQQLQQHNYLVQSKWSGSGGDDCQLPERIGSYHSTAPLEELRLAEDGRPPSVLGVRSSVVKAISSSDGAAYVLRVINGKQVLPAMELLSSARQAVEAWSLLSGHPGLVTPREAFISSDMDGTPSLVLVYPYYPGDVTLAQAHLQPAKLTSGQLVQASPPSEDTLWSYTLQLAAALRAVHAAGLAVRPACLAPTKVLVSSLGQLRISCLGVLEALSGEPAGGPPEDLLAAQREDVTAMGQLLLGLACAGTAPVPPSVELAALHYSPDLLRLLGLLLGVGEGGVFSWRHLIALMGERALMELDTLNMFNNNLMADVRREMENGRLFRLLVKLGYINERPDGDPMASWSETGDRYLLKLFRDFVFHQVGEDGAPLLDWGHVVEALNKLDAGSSEEVLLMSRDEQVMLVVTYADVKRCAEAAYEELKQVGHGSGMGGGSYRS